MTPRCSDRRSHPFSSERRKAVPSASAATYIANNGTYADSVAFVGGVSRQTVSQSVAPEEKGALDAGIKLRGGGWIARHARKQGWVGWGCGGSPQGMESVRGSDDPSIPRSRGSKMSDSTKQGWKKKKILCALGPCGAGLQSARGHDLWHACGRADAPALYVAKAPRPLAGTAVSERQENVLEDAKQAARPAWSMPVGAKKHECMQACFTIGRVGTHATRTAAAVDMNMKPVCGFHLYIQSATRPGACGHRGASPQRGAVRCSAAGALQRPTTISPQDGNTCEHLT